MIFKYVLRAFYSISEFFQSDGTRIGILNVRG